VPIPAIATAHKHKPSTAFLAHRISPLLPACRCRPAAHRIDPLRRVARQEGIERVVNVPRLRHRDAIQRRVQRPLSVAEAGRRVPGVGSDLVVAIVEALRTWGVWALGGYNRGHRRTVVHRCGGYGRKGGWFACRQGGALGKARAPEEGDPGVQVSARRSPHRRAAALGAGAGGRHMAAAAMASDMWHFGAAGRPRASPGAPESRTPSTYTRPWR
jgi:hypothetical protein